MELRHRHLGGRAVEKRPAISARRNPVRCGAWLLAALLVGGCMTPPVGDPARVGPFARPINTTGVAELPATLRRVVLLPLAGGTVAPEESMGELDPVFATELQKQNRFEVIALSRAECRGRFHVAELSSTAPLPHDFVELLRRNYAADGVLFVDVTVFKPYRPLALGVRSKLALLTGEATMLWSFDQVYAATDPAVANGARNHYLQHDRPDLPADLTQAALQSPSRFASYVASEMFETLPPVYRAAHRGKTEPVPVVKDR